MTTPMRPYGRFYVTLSAHEVKHPTAAQLDALQRICEDDNGVAHDAAYAARLFAVACEALEAGGDVGSVYRRYAEVAGVVMKVVGEGVGEG